MILFNEPPYLGKEDSYIVDAIKNEKHISGSGKYSKLCHEFLQKLTGSPKVLLTTSGTDALEMAAILCDIKEGDEVIVPSYTFVSSAMAFVMRGAKIVFVDVRPDTMNIDETKIEAAITDKTKVIVPVHYAGVACEMDTIMEIARKHNLLVVEDAAQGVTSTYKGRQLGSIGDIGCYSFHETKNYSMGEGGTVLVNNPKFIDRADIIRDKGTNRSQFILGNVDKYTWVDIGSSFLPSDMNAAYLYAQLEDYKTIYDKRMHIWNTYNEAFKPLEEAGKLELTQIPKECVHNAHMYYIKLDDYEQRSKMMKHLKENGIASVFHYIPLHSSPAGEKYGVFSGKDEYTTKDSERLLRLPLHFNMTDDDIQTVIQGVISFYEK